MLQSSFLVRCFVISLPVTYFSYLMGPSSHILLLTKYVGDMELQKEYTMGYEGTGSSRSQKSVWVPVEKTACTQGEILQ